MPPNSPNSRYQTIFAALLAFLSGGILSQEAAGQNYPSKPITVVVPFAAGTSTDIACRLFNQGAQDVLRQTLIAENRPGGSAVTGTNYVTKAAPDGYTLLCLGGGSVSRTFSKNLTDDLFSELAPVIQIARGAMFLIVSDKVPASNVREFIEVVKKNPGKYNYASIASTQMMPMEVLKDKTGIQMVNVPYKSLAGVQQALASGDVVAYVGGAVGLDSLFQGGRLKYFMSLADERNPCAPQVPAAPEVGLKGVSAPFSQGFWVPARTSTEIIAKLNEAYNASLKTQAVQDYLKANCSSPVGGAPRVQGDWLRAEHAYWAEAARISKYEPD
jgi:tripartite-type tricarboxylate transporter receptor subunit TctC